MGSAHGLGIRFLRLNEPKSGNSNFRSQLGRHLRLGNDCTCLADLGNEQGEHAGRDLEERLAIATACHTAVRAGDRLDLAKMTALLEDVAPAEDPYSCFHGRPTIVRIRGRDVERWFYRRV